MVYACCCPAWNATIAEEPPELSVVDRFNTLGYGNLSGKIQLLSMLRDWQETGGDGQRNQGGFRLFVTYGF